MNVSYRCGGCDRTWSGWSVCHCAACHETFSGVSLFDLHRTAIGTDEHGGCAHPLNVQHEDGRPVMRQAEDGMWRYPEMTDAKIMRLRGEQ